MREGIITIRRRLTTAAIALTVLVAAGCEGTAGNTSWFGLNVLTPSQAARDAFNPDDPDKRRRAVARLAEWRHGGDEPYLKTYRLLADDSDPTVRAAAIRALAMHGHPADARVLTRHLKDQVDYVRWESAMALRRIHDASAVDPLIQTLQDDAVGEVRQAAAEALGQYAVPRVFQALVGALDDRDYGVVWRSGVSLRLLTGQDFGADGSAWLRWARGRGDLFADQQPYTVTVFVRPIEFGDWIAFWQMPIPAEPQRPTGIDRDQTPVEAPAPTPATTIDRRPHRAEARDADGLYLHVRLDPVTMRVAQVVLADAPPEKIEPAEHHDTLTFKTPEGAAYSFGSRAGMTVLRTKPGMGPPLLEYALPILKESPIDAFERARLDDPTLSLRAFLMGHPAFGGSDRVRPLLLSTS